MAGFGPVYVFLTGTAMAKKQIRLCLTIDVEEEGLFCDKYERENVTVTNVASLKNMEALARRGYPATLFCAHPVFTDAAACRILERMRDDFGMEIGAHLHHWNTPPVVPSPGGKGEQQVLVKNMDHDLVHKKLESLFAAGRAFQSAPLKSFRMGRWDIHSWIFPMLAEMGVATDASVRPLFCGPGKANHFDAPASPYRMQTSAGEIFEVPLTTRPLWMGLQQTVHFLEKTLKLSEGSIAATVQKWGALAVLPVYHNMLAMKLFGLHNIFWGGDTLVLAWHSSEMMPGAAPHIQSAAAVTSLMQRVHSFIDWLEARYDVRGCTLETLRAETAFRAPLKTPSDVPASASVDWLADR